MKETLFIIWMLLTIILALSIVGLLLFISPEYGRERSTWMEIGNDLKENIIKS